MSSLLTNKILGLEYLNIVNRRFADGDQYYRLADVCGLQQMERGSTVTTSIGSSSYYEG